MEKFEPETGQSQSGTEPKRDIKSWFRDIISSTKDMKGPLNIRNCISEEILEFIDHLLTLERAGPPSKIYNCFEDGEVMQVRAYGLQAFPFPITRLQFIRSEDKVFQAYEEMLEELDLIYAWATSKDTSRQQLTLKQENMKVGTLCVCQYKGTFKRAVIAEEAQTDEVMISCYLPEEGRNVAILAADLFSQLDYFTALPRRVLQIKLSDLGLFLGTTAFDDLVRHRFDLTGDLTALIGPDILNPGQPAITLFSPKYPQRAINEIMLEHLFKAFDPLEQIPKEGLSRHDAIVASADELGNVFIQFESPATEFLNSLLAQITDEEFFAAAGLETLPSMSTMCIVSLGKFESYRRAFCYDVTELGLICAVLIDYGNDIKLPPSDIALATHFDPSLRKITPQVIMAHLANVSRLPEEERLFEYVDLSRPVTMKVLVRTNSPSVPVEVVLFAKDNDGGEICINDVVLDLGIGEVTVSEGDRIPLRGPLSIQLDGLAQIPRRGTNWAKDTTGPIVEFQEGATVTGTVRKIGADGELFIEPHNSKTIETSGRIEEFQVARAEDRPCGCFMDGTYFSYRKREGEGYGRCTLTKDPFGLQQGQDQHSDGWTVEVFDVDEHEHFVVPGRNFRRLDPGIARIPPQGARAVWIYDGLAGKYRAWTTAEWKRFGGWALGKTFGMTILSSAAADLSGLQRTVVKLLSDDGSPLNDTDRKNWETPAEAMPD